MANVPYSEGVADVKPDSGGTGATYGDVPQANAAAFGGGIGEAEQGVGQQANQLAQKFADIYNESTARDATTKTAQQMSDAEARFHQLKGNDAVAGLKPFQDEIASIAKNNSDGLSINANSMYQRESASLVNNATFRAGAHVGEQAEKAQTESLNASIANNVNQFAMNATNLTGASYLNKIQDDALLYAHHMGITDPNVADQLVSKNYGLAFSAAIKANIQSNPDVAQKLWDQASTGVITKPDGTTVPYLDAEHRAVISSEMQGEFRRQFQDTNASAQANAAAGLDWDKDGFAQAAKRMGHTDEYIKAESNRLDNVQSDFGGDQARYDLKKSYDNDKALASAGKSPIGVYDPDTVQKAFRKDPDKAQDFLNQVNQLHQVAGFVGGMPTRTPAQNQVELDKFSPHANSPIDFVMQHEGGYVSNDSGKGPTNFGINQESNPDVDVKSLTQDQARNIIKTKYSDAIGADKMSPALAAVAVDSAVNMGVDKTQTLLSQAGGDPQKLLDLRRQEYQRLATNDPEKYGKYLPAWNKRLDDLQASLPNLGQAQNFGEQSDLHDRMQQAAKDYYKKLYDDPSGTINNNDIKLNAMFSDAIQDTKNPQKMVDYVNAVAARQEALQVPEENQSVLPRAYAAAVQKDLAANPEAAPDKLAKMAKDYGNNWPQVYKSLGLTFQQQTQAHTAEDPMMAQYGAMDAKLGSDDLTKGKTEEFIMGDKENLKAMKAAVTSNTDLQSFMLSMRRSGASPQYLQQIQDQAEHMSMAIKFYDPASGSIGDAVNKAVGAMTHGYGYLPSGDRVPLNKIDSISTNIQFYQQHIGDLVSPQQYVPPTYASREHYIQDLQTSSSFLTDEANQRLLMIDNHGLPVLGLDGKQISVGFNDAAMRKPVVRPPDLTAQPNQNLGRGEIAAKGSLADKAPSFSEIPGIAESAGKKVASGVENLAAKVKERESQGGLATTPNANVGVGATPHKGSLADIINEAIK